jgi:protein O-GlcNAc transferase
LGLDPRQAAAYVHLGVNYAAQERFADSIAAYQEAERLNSDLAHLVAQSIDLVEHLQRAKEHPDDPAVQVQLGELYASDGRSDRAIEAFEKVVALAPHWPQGLFTLARLYEAEERDADAVQTYSQGLALDPHNVQAGNNYEKLAIKIALKQDKPVVLTLGTDQKVEIDPHSATSYYQLGLRYLRNDEAEAAVVTLQQAIALQPSADVAHLFLGLAYTSLGVYVKAEAAYRRAIALRPTNPHAYNYLGLTYHQQQRYREALVAYRQALAQAPDYAVAYVNLAASHEALGQTVQALTAYRQALQYDANLQAVQAKIDTLSKQLGQ